MSQYLENMEIGDYIDFRGPNGLLVYEGKGTLCQCVWWSACLLVSVQQNVEMISHISTHYLQWGAADAEVNPFSAVMSFENDPCKCSF